MELTSEQLDILRASAARLDLDRDDVTTTYSGKGMYGRRCVGVTVPGTGGLGFMVRLGVALATATSDPSFAEEFCEEQVCTDSMGLDTIIYWPNVTAPQLVEETCRCGASVRDDGSGSWLDDTGGDGCPGASDGFADEGVHSPEAPVDA